jgi:hypothetical protein
MLAQPHADTLQVLNTEIFLRRRMVGAKSKAIALAKPLAYGLLDPQARVKVALCRVEEELDGFGLVCVALLGHSSAVDHPHLHHHRNMRPQCAPSPHRGHPQTVKQIQHYVSFREQAPSTLSKFILQF